MRAALPMIRLAVVRTAAACAMAGSGLTGMGLATPAVAAPVGDMPVYDPDGSCAALADTAEHRTYAVSNNCIDQEQEAYDRLRQQWPLVPVDGKRACLPLAARHKPMQYTTLQACLRPFVAREANKQRHVFRP